MSLGGWWTSMYQVLTFDIFDPGIAGWHHLELGEFHLSPAVGDWGGRIPWGMGIGTSRILCLTPDW